MAKSEAIEQADGVLRKDYWDGVHGIVDDVKEAIKNGQITDRDGALEYIHETVDGSYWVIYTHANFQVLRYSDNHDAYTEDFGEEGVCKDGSANWPALAYAALERDVLDTLGDLDELFEDAGGE